jgi:hypothetical protein
MGTKTRFVWLLLAAAATIAAIIALPTASDEPWLLPVIGVMWLVTLLALIPAKAQTILRAPLRWLRERPILYWLALLAYIGYVLGAWVVEFQPTNGRGIMAVEYALIFAGLWGLILLTAYGVDEAQLRAMGAKLGSSRLAGAMVMLTTIVLLLIGAETWMRLFYITTDGYGFTAMNYHWYKNFYWGHYNSLGYRDDEPLADAETRLIVLGDSFAMGHGINNIDETFPQLLEQQLGAGFDVNVVAQSGWDSDIEIYYLDEYPLRPDIVILSYYLNDIDHLLTDPSQNPDNAFDFPDNPVASWVILNFFVPNYIYYNLLQFTSQARATDFTNRLVDAHMDDDLWAQQAWHLNAIHEWTQQHNARLVVLLWPQIAAVEQSIPATDRIRDFFLERAVTVVNMADHLIDRNPRDMIVNRFDTHPGVAAQRLAAAALYQALTAQP